MERNIALDILKLIMAFMVVGLHIRFLGDYTELGQYMTVNGIFRIAVPVFLVINGFFFYPTLMKGKEYYWLKRVAILYLVWMTFYSYFWFTPPELSRTWFSHFLQTIIIGYHHLWYIAGMIGAAVLLMLTRKLPSLALAALAAAFFVGGVLIQYFGGYHIMMDPYLDRAFNYHWFHRNALFFSYPFFCFGYLINKHSIQHRFSVRSAVFLCLLATVVLLVESYQDLLQVGENSDFDNYVSLILVAPVLFILFVNLNVPGKNKNIALYSSAVYFIHPFVIFWTRKYTDLGQTPLTFFVILISLILSYFIIKLNERLGFIL